MAVTYNDTFTVADGTQLVNHTADTGQTYTGSTALAIVSNGLFKSGGSTELGFVAGFSTDSEYIVRTVWQKSTGTGSADLIFSVQDASNFYMLRFRDGGLTLFEVVAGSFTSIGSYTKSLATDAFTDTVTLTVDGASIVVDYGTTLSVISVQNTTHARAGQLGFRVQGADALSEGYRISSVEYESLVSAATPTITDINTNNEVVPGTTATLTGTNLTGATGFNIGSEAQSAFTVVSDTSITFTTVRGGNPYNQNLTGTLLHPDGNQTITVQQVPQSGTFAVTAASPNTTDDASLWTGLIDTATSNPITIVDGDQAWVKNPNNLTNLAIQPDGTITANQTGDFVVQIWLASEGVWGGDQTVTFTLPEEAADSWPFSKAITYAAPKAWTWGNRHPKTGMRVRIYK